MKRWCLLATISLVLAGCFPAQKTVVKPAVQPTTVAEKTVPSSAIKTVRITKFFDYACTHCRDAHFVAQNLKKQFGDQVAFELKHFPLSAETFLVAETAECARRQNKFEVYHNLLIEENFGQYDPANLQNVAQQAGLDLEAFNRCTSNGIEKTTVQTDRDEATKLGVTATPYFVLNDSIPIPGAIPEKSFARVIQQVLDGEVE